MSDNEDSDKDSMNSKEESFSDIDDDFDHTIGLSAPSSANGSYNNLIDPAHYDTPTTSTPEGHLNGDTNFKFDEADNSFIDLCQMDNTLKNQNPYSGSKCNGLQENCISSTTDDPSSGNQGHNMTSQGKSSQDNNSSIMEPVKSVLNKDSQKTNGASLYNGVLLLNGRSHKTVKKGGSTGIRDRGMGGSRDQDGCEGDDEEEEEDDANKMAEQLCQLQEIVTEMKGGFELATTALAQIQYDDQALRHVVDANKVDYEKQMADVLQMVLALKNELTGVVAELNTATESQRSLRHQVTCLQHERDLLLEELARSGAIAKKFREKHNSERSQQSDEHLQSSSSANLSGLLERARLSFGNASPSDTANHSKASSSGGAVENGGGGNGGGGGGRDERGTGSQNSSHVTSDSGVTSGQVGDDDGAPPRSPSSVAMSPMMDSYITQQQGYSLGEDIPHIDSSHEDSDSSLTAAANKSLDLSRSLGNACGEDLDLSDDEKEAESIEAPTAPKLPERPSRNGSMVGVKAPKSDPSETSSCATSAAGESHADETSEFKRPLTPPAKLAPHERNAKEVQRGQVARELVETERKYCSCVWTLLDHFAARLRDSGIVPTRDINQMFPPCLTRIYEHHCAFLKKLEERLGHGKWQCVIGDVVSRFIESSECDLLTQYQNYMKEFPTALQLIRKTCRTNNKFKKFLRDSQSHACCEGLDVNAFLLTPVQRMPRYVLLLKQLLKHTDSEHPDHYFLDSSLQRLGEFLNELNDSIEHSMTLVQPPEQPPKLRKRIRDRIPSFRRTNTADSLFDTSSVNLDSSMDSTVASSIEGRFVTRSHRGRPISVHGYPNLMLTSAQSLQAIPVAVDGVISADTTYLVQDKTGRLIPVKGRKVKRSSKSDLKLGTGLSSSFHGNTRPHFLVGSSPKRESPSRRNMGRPHSFGLDLYNSAILSEDITTSTPARSGTGNPQMGYPQDTQQHPYISEDSVMTSDGYVVTSAHDRLMMPPPPPPVASSGMNYSPRIHGAHVHTNGSLSYHQNLKRAATMGEFNTNPAGNLAGMYDSESDTDGLAMYQGNLPPHLIDPYSNMPLQHLADSYHISQQQTNGQGSSQSEAMHPGPLRSQSVVDFNRDKPMPLKSQSTADFRHGGTPALHSDIVNSQLNINMALARSLTMREDGTQNSSPVSMRSTNSNPGSQYPSHVPTQADNLPLKSIIPPPAGFEYKPSSIGNIDRPGSKLSSKRHSAKRYEGSPSRSLAMAPRSPTRSLAATSGSLASRSDTWGHGSGPDSWSSTSVSQEQDWGARFASASTSNIQNLDTSITGSPRKVDLSKKQQKERQGRLAAQSVGDLGSGRKQKTSIRQSLKNMFFRKNDDLGNKDIQHLTIEEENSKINGSTGSLYEKSRRQSLTSQQAAPSLDETLNADDSLVISNVNNEQNTLTLSNEDSEPCSAV